MMAAESAGKDPLPAAQAALPAVIRNLVKSYNILDNNVKTAQGNRLFDYDAVNPETGQQETSTPSMLRDAVSQAIGFTPSRLAEARMMKYLGGKDEYGPMRQQWSNQLTQAYSQLVQAMREGDKEGARALAEEIREINADFNAKWGEAAMAEEGVPFDPTTIDKAVLGRVISNQDAFARPAGQNKYANRKKIAEDMGLQFIDPAMYSNETAKERLTPKE